MELILYSTDCPKCKVIKQKLVSKNISFKEVNDIKQIEQKGIVKVPVLEVNGELLEFVKANAWVNDAQPGSLMGNGEGIAGPKEN